MSARDAFLLGASFSCSCVKTRAICACFVHVGTPAAYMMEAVVM